MSSISTAVPRVDAAEKSSGAAQYVADMVLEGMLYARCVRTPVSRGLITNITYPEMPDGYSIVDSKDIPKEGTNGILMIDDDWPVFAHDEVRFLGQTVALIVGPDRQVLDRLVSGVSIACEEAAPAYTIEESLDLAGGPIHGKDNAFVDYRIEKGSWDDARKNADRIVEEEFRTGFQEHVYMEPQGCLITQEDGGITLYASTQCPFYLQKSIAHALGCPREEVRVIQAHTGGGFGGKEHYPDVLATALGVAVRKIGSPIQLIYDRHEDMAFTPKRHPSRVRFQTALDAEGNVLGINVDTCINAGAFMTCSNVVLQRAVFTATGAYNFPNVAVHGRALATNTVPSDAFRGFGAPQALFAIEQHMNHLAAETGKEPLAFKRDYFLKNGDTTNTGGKVYDEVLLEEMIAKIEASSGYSAKRASMDAGRGIGVSIFNHGCGFTGSGERDIIKGEVELEKYTDDRVRIKAAGVDMGQGVLTTFKKVVARVLDIPMEQVLYDRPDTSLVPDSGPSCASRSIMVVGYLLQEAARRLKAGWKSGEAQNLRQAYQHPPGMEWDPELLVGDAYPSYGWGVNVVEASVDSDTGEIAVENIWTVYDVGVPIDSRIVEGQSQGGMIQALGYASLEKLEVRDGRFMQTTMADYTIPTSLDYPEVATEFVENPYPFGPFGAKGGGELVFDGAGPALAQAVEQAVGRRVHALPLTPEAVLELTP